MTRFYKLNKKKIWFAYKALSLTFMSFACILLLISYSQNSLPSTRTIFSVLFAFGLCIPLMCLIIITTPYFVKQIRMKTINNVERKLIYIGFVNEKIYAETKWFFTEEVLYKKDGKMEEMVTIKRNHFCFDLANQSHQTSFCISLNKLDEYSAKDIVEEINKNKKQSI